MRRNVWIWNHYATNMFFNEAGRHYWFAENLIKEGYAPTIFCASTNHSSQKNNIDTEGRIFSKRLVNNIPFVFVKTPYYKGNGLKRIFNMISFYIRLFSVAKRYARENGKPDVILASSVHPLTLVAGIKIARKFGVPCICEVRDLWPESLVAYGCLRRDTVLAKVLYEGEKWIYKKADVIIMTWEGGIQYIKDKGWDNLIDMNKVKHISNGVLVKTFDINSQENQMTDDDLNDSNNINIVYAGSIRKVNNLGLLLDSAKIIQEKNKKIKFLVYGHGDEKEMLEDRCKKEAIKNVVFKGWVEKKKVPYILKKSYANILHNTSTSLDKYGQSQNKFFEYLAAGRCVIQTYTTGYSILQKYNCGSSAPKQDPESIAEIILKVCSDYKKANQMGENARKAAYEFDFKKLTNKLIEIIEEA